MRLLTTAPVLALPLLLAACGGGTPASAPAAVDPARLQAMAADPAVRERGKALYLTGKGFCTTCHGVDGRGATPGLNLVDGVWLHGGSLAEIQRSITEGYPDKGMRAWKEAFQPEEIAALAVHVHGLASASAAASR